MERGLKKLLLCFTGTIFFVSTFILLPGIIKAYKSESWPTVTAIITQNSITADAPGASDAKYFLNIEYEYKIGDQTYTSANYGTRARLNSRSEFEMVEKQKQFPVNKEITIVYDPDDISSARIPRGLAWSHKAALGFIVVIGGGFFVCLFIKTPAPKPREGV